MYQLLNLIQVETPNIYEHGIKMEGIGKSGRNIHE